MTFDPPVFVNVRDRMTPAAELVSWLLSAGHQRITILDNDSTWPPTLHWFEKLAEFDVKVNRLGRNLGSRAIWIAGLNPRDEHFIYTDPDVVPISECPNDLVARCLWAMERYPEAPKVGPGLFLDDLPPDHWVLSEERALYDGPHAGELEPGVFQSLIDTTFALYQPGTEFGYGAIRLGFPYQARHTSWYMSELDEENRYYLERARGGALGSSWRDTVLS